jgi:predicted branched-subunit amino acid permease
MNARFLLMSATLAPYFKETRLIKIISSLILIIPSVFTGCLVRFKKNKCGSFGYFLGLAIPIYLVSIICTTAGFFLSTQLNSPILYKMIDIILPLQFTALAASHWPKHQYVCSYWGGFILAPLIAHFSRDYNLLLTPFLIGVFMVLFENLTRKSKTT